MIDFGPGDIATLKEVHARNRIGPHKFSLDQSIDDHPVIGHLSAKSIEIPAKSDVMADSVLGTQPRGGQVDSLVDIVGVGGQFIQKRGPEPFGD